jgi:hypothetical protein
MAGAANAQATSTLDLYPSGITARLGVAFPGERVLQDVGHVLGNIGLEYKINRPLFENGETYFALDFMFRAFSDGTNGSAIPFTINHRMYTSDDEFRTYWFLGLGATYFDTTVGSGTALTLRGGVGKELGPRVIGEIAGLISTEAAGTHINCITVNVGYRF